MFKKMFHYSFVLAMICALSIFGVSLIYSLTLEPIQASENTKKMAALSIILHRLKVDTQAKKFTYKTDTEVQEYEVYLGRDPKTGEVKGWGIKIGEQGYSSVLQTMVGISDTYQVIAIEIVFQQETPGLGTQCISTGPKKLSSLWDSSQKAEIKRPWFQDQF
jgi:Na+-translocating ferredoxin:NAD+ oxidoreductase RnfG subunit